MDCQGVNWVSGRFLRVEKVSGCKEKVLAVRLLHPTTGRNGKNGKWRELSQPLRGHSIGRKCAWQLYPNGHFLPIRPQLGKAVRAIHVLNFQGARSWSGIVAHRAKAA